MSTGALGQQLRGDHGHDREHQHGEVLVPRHDGADRDHAVDHDPRGDQDRGDHPPELGGQVHDRHGGEDRVEAEEDVHRGQVTDDRQDPHRPRPAAPCLLLAARHFFSELVVVLPESHRQDHQSADEQYQAHPCQRLTVLGGSVEPAVGKPAGLRQRTFQEGELRQAEQEDNPQHRGQHQGHRSPQHVPTFFEFETLQRELDQQRVVDSQPGTQEEQRDEGYKILHDQRPWCG